MKQYLLTAGLFIGLAATASAQSAIDALQINGRDMKGTARFMSMGGAFGALGADLSTISYNPAGIGVYRSNDVGFTVDLDCQNATSNSNGFKNTDTQTKFLLNNIGGVATLRLNSSAVPNLNLGFTFNKGVSFNRKYSGYFPQLRNSVSNYIAGIANASGTTEGDVIYDAADNYEPYLSSTPWLPILAYDSFLIAPDNISDTETQWSGQWGSGTAGNAQFAVEEKGSIGEYNIALGGNIRNKFYIGMNFDIVNFNYTRESWWNENLTDAYVMDGNHNVGIMDSSSELYNYYNVNGTGFKYSLGLIYKPIQELRLGFAFHTPTYYTLTENYSATIDYRHGPMTKYDYAETNNGNMAYDNFNLYTPWRFIFSAAGVIGGKLTVSADYELSPTSTMHFTQASGGGYGWNDPWDWDYGYDDYYPWYSPASRGSFVNNTNNNAPYSQQNNEIKEISQATHTLRLGAEYRVTNNFSVRAGYSFVTSPVKESVRNNDYSVSTTLCPSYTFDNTTNYITCGLGYKISHFYADLAYVYKHVNATYHAYGPDPTERVIVSPQSQLSLNNNQVVLTCGFRF